MFTAQKIEFDPIGNTNSKQTHFLGFMRCNVRLRTI